MRNWIGIVLIAVVFVQPAWAQAPEPLPAGAPAVIEPDDVNRRELEKWIQEHTAWQEWAETWLNRRQGPASTLIHSERHRVALQRRTLEWNEPPHGSGRVCAWTGRRRDPLAEGCPLRDLKDDFSSSHSRADRQGQSTKTR